MFSFAKYFSYLKSAVNIDISNNELIVKMKTLTTLVGLLLTTVFLALLGYGIYWAISLIWPNSLSTNPTLAASLSIGSLVLIICTLILAWALNRAANRKNATVITQKARTYELFTQSWFTSSTFQQEEQQFQLHRLMVLWAEDEVLKKYLKLREMSGDTNAKKEAIEHQAAEVVLAMRKDLGAPNSLLQSVELGKLLTNSEPAPQEV